MHLLNRGEASRGAKTWYGEVHVAAASPMHDISPKGKQPIDIQVQITSHIMMYPTHPSFSLYRCTQHARERVQEDAPSNYQKGRVSDFVSMDQ